MSAAVLSDLIETRRLFIRIPRPGDGHAHYEALVESLPPLRQFLGALPWIAREQSVELSEVICANSRNNFDERKDFQFFIFEKNGGRFIGGCGLYRIDWTLPQVEVGYWCRTSSTGQGFIAEAVDAMVRYAMDELKAVRVELLTDVDNVQSRKVADRCGFELEGVHRNARRDPDGALRDMCTYARVKT